MTIEQEVIEWAKGCSVEFEQPTNIEEHVVFVGMLIRLRASQDVSWLWQKIERDAEQIIAWTPAIRNVVVGGIEFPPRKMNWVEWFQAIQDLEAA